MAAPLLLFGAMAGALALLPLFGRKRRRSSSSSSAGLTAGPDDSTREDQVAVLIAEDGVSIDVDDATWSRVGGLWHAGYRWEGGTPRTTIQEAHEKGVDCGGAVQVCSVANGDLLPSAPDRGTKGIGDDTIEIPIGSQRPGDFALYRRRHAMYVVSYPRPDLGGHSHVFGASGGDSVTQGVDPSAPGYKATAAVKLFRSARYRDDFLCYARWKPTAAGVVRR